MLAPGLEHAIADRLPHIRVESQIGFFIERRGVVVRPRRPLGGLAGHPGPGRGALVIHVVPSHPNFSYNQQFAYRFERSGKAKAAQAN
jgi:hypothetical protein